MPPSGKLTFKKDCQRYFDKKFIIFYRGKKKLRLAH